MADFVRIYNEKFNDGSYVVFDEKLGRNVVKGWRNVKGSPIGRKLEALLDNGDRRICLPLIMTAIKFNVYSESDWGESNAKMWTGIKSYVERMHGYNIEDYLRQKTKEDALVWEHIDVGTDKDFLWSEKQKSIKAVETPSCGEACAGCGMSKNNPNAAEKAICAMRDKWFGEFNLPSKTQTAEDER